MLTGVKEITFPSRIAEFVAYGKSDVKFARARIVNGHVVEAVDVLKTAQMAFTLSGNTDLYNEVDSIIRKIHARDFAGAFEIIDRILKP